MVPAVHPENPLNQPPGRMTTSTFAEAAGVGQINSAFWPRLWLTAFYASWSQLLPWKTITPNLVVFVLAERLNLIQPAAVKVQTRTVLLTDEVRYTHHVS